MATEGALSSTGYMLHHLTHNASGKMQSIIDFSVINYDTIFFSILMLVVSLWLLRRAAKNATSGVPGKFQCAVEMLVDMVEEQSKSIVHGDRTFIAPCALTVFVWVVLMNAIDLIAARNFWSFRHPLLASAADGRLERHDGYFHCCAAAESVLRL